MLARHAERIAVLYGCGPGADLHGPVARGEQGEVWRLTTSRGAWAVKLLDTDQPAASDLRADAAYQQSLHDAGVPLPMLVPTLAGDVLSEIDGWWLRVYEWIELDGPDTGLDPAAVGELVASIHRVRSVCEQRPVDPWYTDPVGADRWDELLAELAARAAPFAGRLAELRDGLVALDDLLAAPRHLQVCHRDLWADNVRRRSAGGLCVIDWEDAGLADPSQELALVLFEFGRGESDRLRTLYDAYVRSGGVGRIEGAGDFSMLIAQLGHIGEDACASWLEPGATEGAREHQAARVEEFIAEPLTLATIDHMLGAVLR